MSFSGLRTIHGVRYWNKHSSTCWKIGNSGIFKPTGKSQGNNKSVNRRFSLSYRGWFPRFSPKAKGANVPGCSVDAVNSFHSTGVSAIISSGSTSNKNMGESSGNGGAPAEVDRSKCVFCRIADGHETNEILYQDEDIVVFQDIKPAAKYHFLVVTREHIKDSKSLVASQIGLVDRLVEVGNKVLNDHIKKDSPNADGLETSTTMGFHWPPFHSVSHLHLHVISPSSEMGFIARGIFRPNSFWFVTADYIRERLQKMAITEK